MGEINLDDFKPEKKMAEDGDAVSRILRQSKPMMPESEIPKTDSSEDRALVELEKKVSEMKQEAQELMIKGDLDLAQRKMKSAHELEARGKSEILG